MVDKKWTNNMPNNPDKFEDWEDSTQNAFEAGRLYQGMVSGAERLCCTVSPEAVELIEKISSGMSYDLETEELEDGCVDVLLTRRVPVAA